MTKIFQPTKEIISSSNLSKYENYLNSLTLISTTYQRTAEERQNVIDRVNLAKKNMPISQMAMKRWFSDKYLEKNPELSVVIAADKKTQYENVITVMDLLKQNQIHKVGLLLKPEK